MNCASAPIVAHSAGEDAQVSSVTLRPVPVSRSGPSLAPPSTSSCRIHASVASERQQAVVGVDHENMS